jgi:ribosomal-protein-alanine N-acetyltransferase
MIMAFGPIMRVKAGELLVELAPLTKENVTQFIENGGMQHASVTKYLARTSAPVNEDELEWFERTRTDKASVIWGIYVIDGDERKLIGNTALENITRKHIHQATSGSLIFDQSYWGKGIASSIHKARTWYAFQYLGLHRIMSAVIQGNVGSLKALRKSGYELVYVERNTVFVDGHLRHQDNLECLNPNEPFWSQWWRGERSSKKSQEAKKRTIDALSWAEKNVTLL